MKYLMVTLAFVACCWALTGCEKKAQPPRPRTFDPKLDAAAAPSAVDADPLLLEDQAKIAKLTPRKRPTSVPADDAIEGVKKAMGEIIRASADSQFDKLVAFFADEDVAKTMSQLGQSMAVMREKAKALGELINERLGADLPPELSMIGSQISAQTSAIAAANDALDKITFEVQNNTVVATAEGGQQTTFVQADGAWKIKLKPVEKEIIALFPDMIAGIDKTLDDISAGIADGSITKANLNIKAAQFAKANTEKVMAKFTALANQAMAQSVKKAEATSEEEEATEPSVEGGKDPGQIDAILALWASNKGDEAIDEFLAVNWKAQPNFQGDSFFALSEETFAAGLDESQLGDRQKKLQNQVLQLQRVTNQVRVQAKKLAKEGDVETARQNLKILAACGAFLTAPTRLKSVQTAGATVVKDSKKALDDIARDYGQPVEPNAATKDTAAPAVAEPNAPPATNTSTPEEQMNKANEDKARQFRDRALDPAKRAVSGGGL
ncbi:MAG: hypothetical protein WC869_09940 [Phycisphaerae bacterium]|jgi:hypothetical protein